MPTVNKEHIEKILANVIDPNHGLDLVSAKCIKDISMGNGKPGIQVELGYPATSFEDDLSALIMHEFKQNGIEDCNICINTNIISHSVQQGTTLLPNVKNTIAIASGKGGVGKSTTATNLALALQAEGARVGILDADIYGPSQPRMLGLKGKPETVDGRSIEPKVNYHIQSMSIGYLIDEDTPMIWRGPMATGALEQLLNETNWHDLDYLIIDLPPGTGDIQLTLCQKIPVSSAVIVTTPQDIAVLDAKKALKMFEKVNVPVLGIVENMSTHICSQCGHEERIFGDGGGEQMASQYDVDLLGSLPLDIHIREGVDNGKPTVAIDPYSAISGNYRKIARRIAARLALQAKDYSSRFPKIVVEND